MKQAMLDAIGQRVTTFPWVQAARSLSHREFNIAGMAISGVLFGAALLIMLWPGRLFVGLMLNDFFLLLEPAYRLTYGQATGIDYTNPFGFMTYAPQAFFFRLTGDLALSALYAQAGYATIVVALCWYLALTRLHLVTGVALTVTAGVLMLAPWVLGTAVFHPDAAQSTTAMFYNRFGFILVTLVALFALEPNPTAKTKAERFDTAVPGLVAAIAFYTKVPYGLAVIGLTCYWSVLVLRRPERLKIFGAVFVACVLLLEIGLPGLLFAYLREQAIAADIVGAVRIAPILRGLVFTAPEWLLAGAVPLLVLWRLKLLTLLELGYFGALLLGSVLLLTQSAQGFLIVAPMAIAAFAVTRCIRNGHLIGSEVGLLGTLVVALCLVGSVMTLLPPATVAIVRHAKDAAQTAPLPGLPAAYARLRVPRDVDLDVMRASFEGRVSAREAYVSARSRLPLNTYHAPFPSEYLATLLDLPRAAALCGTQAGQPAITDFTDLAPSFLGQPPASGYTYMHYGRSFTPTKHPTAERLFGRVGCLLDPKFPIETEARDAIWTIYGSWFAKTYEPVGETAFWRVLARRTGPTAPAAGGR